MKNNSPDIKLIIKNVSRILIWSLFSYVAMVIISHFSVYKDAENYSFKDTISAIFLKTDVPSEFFFYFGAVLLIGLLVALCVNWIIKTVNNN